VIRAACLALALACSFASSRAHAQDVVVLVVGPDVSELERDAIATGLRDELGVDVVPAAAEGAIVIRVSIRARRARVEVTRPARERTVRTELLSDDPSLAKR
jgi:hypothetical protein